jgi:hypothetical protein
MAETTGPATTSTWRRIVSPRGGITVGLICLAAACLYYRALLDCCSKGFFGPAPYGLTFNSMLLHLLNGRFDVDPQTIGDEGSLRNGLVYTYFGVLPGLLRLPFLSWPNFADTDFTRLSCLTAVMIMAGFKLLSVRTVWWTAGTSNRRGLLIFLIIAILFGGPQIQFLRPSIYQEVLLWASALSAGFVFFVLRGHYSENGFSSGVLSALGLLAGLCLLTRVSTALGLYIALGLLCLHLAWRRLRNLEGQSRSSDLVSLILPIAILLFFAALTAYINFERWGNPLLFASSEGYIWAMINAPDRFSRVKEYGEFNLIRFGYNLAYYFFPIWILRTADGTLLWSAFQERTIDSVELPPSSFFLSDPLIIGLAVYCLVQLIRHKDVLDRGIILTVLIGFAVPTMLILTFISATFRYRMEFYPFFELCAFLGFNLLVAKSARPPNQLFAAAAIGTVVVSHVLWLLYIVSPFGPASTALGSMDVISYYLTWFGK